MYQALVSSTMLLMIKKNNYHKEFHDILGHVSTIRSGCSVLVEDDYKHKIDPEVFNIINAMYQHSNELVTELEKLKKQIYKNTESLKN